MSSAYFAAPCRCTAGAAGCHWGQEGRQRGHCSAEKAGRAKPHPRTCKVSQDIWQVEAAVGLVQCRGTLDAPMALRCGIPTGAHVSAILSTNFSSANSSLTFWQCCTDGQVSRVLKLPIPAYSTQLLGKEFVGEEGRGANLIDIGGGAVQVRPAACLHPYACSHSGRSCQLSVSISLASAYTGALNPKPSTAVLANAGAAVIRSSAG